MGCAVVGLMDAHSRCPIFCRGPLFLSTGLGTVSFGSGLLPVASWSNGKGSQDTRIWSDKGLSGGLNGGHYLQVD